MGISCISGKLNKLCAVYLAEHIFSFFLKISQNTFFLSERTQGNSGIPFSVLPLLQQYVSVFQTLTVPCFDLQLFPTFLFALCCNISRNSSKNKTSLIQNRSDTDSSLVITFTAFSHVFPYVKLRHPSPRTVFATPYHILISSCVSKVMPQRSLFCKSHLQE